MLKRRNMSHIKYHLSVKLAPVLVNVIIQESFKVPPARFEELEDTLCELKLKKTMWQAVKDWRAYVIDWKSTPMANVNTETINAKVQYYSKLVYQLARGLPGNPVVAMLKASVSDFKVTNSLMLHT
jgi:hypothetical protein